ncbi:MAG: hypothetical protein HC886_09900 [Leptolyngbyaceae cyanobacterium SM1_1_3]|nr:hypothetical protein [Leptolyngbyaceae cyanobacterium SM1_1_3]NJN02613.1 hypothetical protein [Leptolyngbyaceae cyanobacterium RM1_1_2]NJO10820.1 hypothetical protein [Leptolyngbyaceae cyanobacterium SL_1_1]
MYNNSSLLEDMDLDDVMAIDDIDDIEDMIEELDEFEDEDFGESDDLMERRRRGRRRPVRTARQGGLTRSRPTSSSRYATKAQLDALAMRVDKKIATNAVAIKKVDRKVNVVSDAQKRQAIALKKEQATRKKMEKDFKDKLQLLALLPAIARPSSKEVRLENGETAKVLVESNDSLSLLLPLLLTGGLGGSDSSGGGGDSNMLILALALSGGLGGK